MFHSDSFMSCVDHLLGYSTGEIQTILINVHVVFGAMDEPLASCMLVQFSKSRLKL